MRTHLALGTALALVLIGYGGAALATHDDETIPAITMAQASGVGGPHPTQSGAEPPRSNPPAVGSPAPVGEGTAQPPANPESTVGLAPADQPVNNANRNVAGLKVPSSQEDTAAHNPSVLEHDKQPTLSHTFNFTPEQKDAIRNALAGTKSAATKPDFEVKETTVLPDSTELKPIPDSVAQQMPWVKPYRYVKLDNRILLVDPLYSAVVSIIE